MALEGVLDFSAQIREMLQFNSDAGLLVVGLIYFVVLYAVFRSLAVLALWVVRRLSGKTKTTFDDRMIEAGRSIVKPLVTFASLYLVFAMLAPSAALFGIPVHELFVIVGILLGAHVGQRFVRAVIRWYEDELLPASKHRRKELFSFISNIISVLVYATAVTIILSRMGIEIAPLLAGLGVAGLAVALALQDSLTNLFAGIHILADKPFKVGDFIIVDGDQSKKGWVDEIGWRSTRIRFPDNNVLIVPNARLASSQIINTYQPSKPVAVVMNVGASYGDAPDKVIMVLERVVDRVISSHPDAEKDFKIVRLNDYKDSSVEYTIVVRVKEFMAQYGVVGEIKRQVYYEFGKEGITIPFPQTDVHFFQEKQKGRKKAG